VTDQIKKKIRQHFNKAAKTYDAHCTVQNQICTYSLKCLREFGSDFHHIADFACGTGESTLRLMQSINFKHCYALDFAKQLLTVAHNKLLKYNNIQILEANFEQPLPISNQLDFIFCNMGLQWSDDIAKTLNLWHTYLDDRGLLLFSMPTSNNFKELDPRYKPKFMAHQNTIKLFCKHKWDLLLTDTIEITQSFDCPLLALRSLKATGTNYSKGTYERSGLSTMKINHVFTSSTEANLTYHIGIYLARKI
jgi:malonyl-CoA O-methyltransferase